MRERFEHFEHAAKVFAAAAGYVGAYAPAALYSIASDGYGQPSEEDFNRIMDEAERRADWRHGPDNNYGPAPRGWDRGPRRVAWESESVTTVLEWDEVSQSWWVDIGPQHHPGREAAAWREIAKLRHAALRQAEQSAEEMWQEWLARRVAADTDPKADRERVLAPETWEEVVVKRI